MTLIQRALFTLLCSLSLATHAQMPASSLGTPLGAPAPKSASADQAPCMSAETPPSAEGSTQDNVCPPAQTQDSTDERLAPILTKEAATDPALFHAFLRDIGYLRFGLIAMFARKGNYDSVSNQSALDSKAVPITMIQEDGFLMNARGTSVMMRPASPTRQGSLSCARNCLAARIATLIPTLSCPQITQSLMEGFEAIEINDVFLNREEFSLEAAIQACASQRPRALIQMIRRN